MRELLQYVCAYATKKFEGKRRFQGPKGALGYNPRIFSNSLRTVFLISQIAEKPTRLIELSGVFRRKTNLFINLFIKFHTPSVWWLHMASARANADKLNAA